MKKIRYAIIDDDDFAHDELIKLMQIHTDFECVAHYFNVIETTKEINHIKPDFIFLDVEMPNLNGFELLNFLDKSVQVVICSSHKNYAYEGFEHQVFDFLSKPIQQEKLFKTIYRLSEKCNVSNHAALKVSIAPEVDKTYLFVSKLRDKALLKIQVKDICVIKKLGNDLEIKTLKNDLFYRKDNINSIINELPATYFRIINRGTIINVSKVHWINDYTIQTPDGEIFEVSKNYR
jgi:DNA-binding LytR/AlgR family response regulator